MKRFILLCLLFSMFYSIGAYEIESSSQIYFVITPESQYETLGIVPNGVFTANNKEYTNYMGTILGDDEWIHTDSLLQLRKDGTKYFCYNSKSCSEHLLFDFGLRTGDSFTEDFNETVYEVKDVRDTLVNDESLCLIELMDTNGNCDIWVEGIGSIYTGFLRANEYYKNARLLISSHFKDGEFLIDEIPTYLYPNSQDIKTANMSIKELSWDKPLKTEADWEAYWEWIHAPTDLNAQFEGNTLHIWGRLKTSSWLHSYAACELKGSQIFFKEYPYDFIHQADGINSYDIDTRIPGFEKGKYNVKLSRNITVELECSDYTPTSVNSIIPSLQQIGLYNLQGYRLSCKPTHGINIIGGKKVLVK